VSVGPLTEARPVKPCPGTESSWMCEKTAYLNRAALGARFVGRDKKKRLHGKNGREQNSPELDPLPDVGRSGSGVAEGSIFPRASPGTRRKPLAKDQFPAYRERNGRADDIGRKSRDQTQWKGDMGTTTYGARGCYWTLRFQEKEVTYDDSVPSSIFTSWAKTRTGFKKLFCSVRPLGPEKLTNGWSNYE